MQQPLTCFERLPVMCRDQLPIKRKINDIFELIGEEFRCSPNRNLIVHVYQGANEAGHQWYPFHRAANILMHKIIVLSMSQVTIFVYLRSTFKLTLNLIIDKIFFQVEKNLVAAFLTGTGKF